MAASKKRKFAKKTRSKKSIQGKDKSLEYNKTAQWKAYRELQARADEAWDKFRSDVEDNASSDILLRDNNDLRLLLAECNYMARECMRIAGRGKKKAR